MERDDVPRLVRERGRIVDRLVKLDVMIQSAEQRADAAAQAAREMRGQYMMLVTDVRSLGSQIRQLLGVPAAEPTPPQPCVAGPGDAVTTEG